MGAGRRTWLNVTVLSLTFVLMTGFNGVVDGWKQESRRNTRIWEVGAGQIWHPEYDRFDLFTLQDAHGPIPQSLHAHIQKGNLTPVLVVQGVIYPQGRMQNVLLKGIEPAQNIVQIPSQGLQNNSDEVCAIIGSRTAKSAQLEEGDRVMMRWRDKNGVFDAREILIVGIFETTIAAVDVGQLWIDIAALQQMTGMDGEATFLIAADSSPVRSDVDGWRFKDLAFLMADLDMKLKHLRIESYIVFFILLAIALLAVFDTQMLSIFRRQREIGTYVALGMTPRCVTLLFTLEGTCFSLLAIFASAIWGIPGLAWFSRVGYKIPDVSDKIGMAVGNVLYPTFKLSSVVISMVVVVCLSAVISYFPSRKIARQNVVEALKGKIV